MSLILCGLITCECIFPHVKKAARKILSFVNEVFFLINLQPRVDDGKAINVLDFIKNQAIIAVHAISTGSVPLRVLICRSYFTT